MSQENVEIVRRFNAAFNAHDIEGTLSLLDPQFEYVDHMGAVGEAAGSGLKAFRRQCESWWEAFPNFRAAAEEFIDAGDRVVCVSQMKGTGARSVLEYHQPGAEIFTLREAKILHFELGFRDKAAALEAAGMRE